MTGSLLALRLELALDITACEHLMHCRLHWQCARLIGYAIDYAPPLWPARHGGPVVSLPQLRWAALVSAVALAWARFLAVRLHCHVVGVSVATRFEVHNFRFD